MFCTNCGSTLIRGALFCSRCNQATNSVQIVAKTAILFPVLKNNKKIVIIGVVLLVVLLVFLFSNSSGPLDGTWEANSGRVEMRFNGNSLTITRPGLLGPAATVTEVEATITTYNVSFAGNRIELTCRDTGSSRLWMYRRTGNTLEISENQGWDWRRYQRR